MTVIDVDEAAARVGRVTSTVEVTGTGDRLVLERDGSTGALLAVRGGGRTYLETGPAGPSELIWDGGFVRVVESRRDRTILRSVTTAEARWEERYGWDADGLLVDVDGTTIRRDDAGRVVACLPPAGGGWFYTWTDGHLTAVSTPSARRAIAVDRHDRPLFVTEDGRVVAPSYDARGARQGVGPLPPSYHRDAAGRLWSITAADGSIRSVFLWDGNRCLARVDGQLGEPVAAVFCLDPSATPVRVIDRSGSRRIPRDAFGEGLLGEPLVPGLFGGTVHGGIVHLPLRRLDPTTGTFCEPDPCHGGVDDPRRAAGFEGDLPVDPSSSHQVCRGDPIGRADPTGGVSAGLIISDFTWSLQNNLLTFFGLDWWFNLFASLFTGFQLGNFGSSEGLSSSDRLGSFGIRRDGFVAWLTQDQSRPQPNGRAFTTQHLVWSDAIDFDSLDNGEVIDPGGELALAHYGTALHAAPSGANPMVLRSMSGAPWLRSAPPAWARAGGPAAEVAPGTASPWFPSGGLHLDSGPLQIRGPVDCPLTEVQPAEVTTGTLELRAFLRTVSGPSGLVVADLVAVDDGAVSIAFTTVVSVVPDGDRERIHLEDDLAAFPSLGITVMPLDPAPASSETRGAGALPNTLDARPAAGVATAPYATGDLLRLTASGGQIAGARVTALESAVPIDRPVPATFAAPLQIALTTVAPAGPNVTVTAVNQLRFPAGTAPGEGSLALVGAGAAGVPVRVVGPPAGDVVTVDATLPAATVGTAVPFRAITGSSPLGTRDGAPEAGNQLTYRPVAAGQAPDGSAAAPVVVRIDAGADVAVRRVTGAPAHDVVQLDRAPPGTAPWRVERMRPAAGRRPATALTLERVVGLVVAEPDAIADAPALLLARVAGAPPTAGTQILAAVDVVGAQITAPAALPAAMPARPTVGEPFLVGPEVVAARSLRVRVTVDRDLALPAGEHRLVALVADGPVFGATRLSDSQIVVVPEDHSGGGAAVATAFPRFAEGDLVQISGATTDDFHVIAVDGLQLTVAGGSAAAVPVNANRVQRLDVNDPMNGGPFLGRRVQPVAGSPRAIEVDVWTANTLPANLLVGIVTADGAATHPAHVSADAQTLTITLSEPATNARGVPLAQLDVPASGYAARIARDGNVLLLADAPANVGTQAGQTLVVVAQRSNGVTATGRLQSGTMLVPEDEDHEHGRRQALVDHELTHTLQYAKWGPLWFNFFPMLALELPGILATDAELPEYSPFMEAMLTAGAGTNWDMQVRDLHGVRIRSGDKLQVLSGSRIVQVEVVSVVQGTELNVRTLDDGSPPTGLVNVRKLQSSPVFEGFYHALQLFTHGGLLNILSGTTWGAILWLIAKGVWGLGRVFTGKGDFYAAIVQAEGRELLLTDAGGKEAITSGSRVIVRQGDKSLVRTVTRDGDVAKLTEAVAFTGQVQLTTYASHDPMGHFDWLSYHPATIPDLENPALIELDTGRPDLAANDRVEIIHVDFQNKRTHVTAVNGGRVELAQPIPVSSRGERSLRIAKIFAGARDPMGNADSVAMTEMGMGWMKWLFDPYGQIQYAASPTSEGWLWTLRTVRWLLGSQMWSALPALGYVWWFRLLPIIPEHETAIEQEASEESGDLYSPLGRLLGQRSMGDFGTCTMVVGDVARYRFFREGRAASDVRRDGRLDSSGQNPGATPPTFGVHVLDDVRIVPNVLAGAVAASSPPNGTADTNPAATDRPARVGADGFYRPARATQPPGGLTPALRGSVPRSATLEKTLSGYVAFSKPGTHRITVRNGITQAQDAADTQAAGVQPIFFDATVSGVTVTVAGQPVAEDGLVELIPFQRAEVVTAPNGNRTYRVTVPQPTVGPSVTIDAGTTLVGAGRQPPAPLPPQEPVEVSRFYAAAGGSFTDGGLAKHGVHLGGDVHIAVRRFAVRLVDTVPLRPDPNPASAALASLAVGATGILLVPAPVAVQPVLTRFDGRGPLPTDPQLVVEALPGDQWPTTFLTPGSATRLSFTAAIPLPAAVDVECTIGLGPSATNPVNVFCRFQLTP